MNGQHSYELTVEWTGNQGTGTSAYRTYERSHTITVEGKPDVLASSDPTFRGDRTKYNPEELLVASASSCHMLSYLHVCAMAGVVVTAYVDHATGLMEEDAKGGGKFTSITLHPVVTVADPSMVEKAQALHHQANELCFIANSLNFPVLHQPTCQVASEE